MNNAEQLEFQKECFLDVLKEYNYTTDGWINDSAYHFSRLLGKIANSPGGSDVLDLVFDRALEGENDEDLLMIQMLDILFEYQTRVLELENCCEFYEEYDSEEKDP